MSEELDDFIEGMRRRRRIRERREKLIGALFLAIGTAIFVFFWALSR